MSTYTKNLKILFWNARSILQRKHELQKIIQDIDIFICVESWLQPLPPNTTIEKELKISGFKTFHKDRHDNIGGGILFLVKEHLKALPIQIINPSAQFETYGIKIENTTPKLDIFAVYRPPRSNPTQADWDSIMDYIEDDSYCILTGDFNAHHRFWNCKQNDANGLKLLNSIVNKNLIVHNTTTESRINVTTGQKSNIDLILSTVNLSDKIDTVLYDENYGSDHFPILINLTVNKTIYRKKSFRIKTKRTDWEGFSNSLIENYEKFLENTFCNLTTICKYEFFINLISNAITSNTPQKNHKKSNSNRTNPVKWWDAECDKASRLRKAAFKKWIYSKKQEDYINYKKQNAIAKGIFKNRKKESFINFAENINFQTNPTFVWNTIKIFKNKYVKVKSPSTIDDTNKDKVEIALNKISPSWAATDPDWIPNCKANDFLSNQFQFSEFNIALNSRDNSSSPGLDGIDYEILRKLPIKYK